MDLLSCFRLLLKTQYCFTVLLSNTNNQYNASKKKAGKNINSYIKSKWLTYTGSRQL